MTNSNLGRFGKKKKGGKVKLLGFESEFAVHNSYVGQRRDEAKYWKLTKNMEVETDGKSYQKFLEICKL